MKVKDPDLTKTVKSLLKYRKKQVQGDWWDEISNEEKASIEKLKEKRSLVKKYKEKTKIVN